MRTAIRRYIGSATLLAWELIKEAFLWALKALRIGGDMDFLLNRESPIWVFAMRWNSYIIPAIGFAWLAILVYQERRAPKPSPAKGTMPAPPEMAKTPPKITPHGGGNFSLEIRPSLSGYYYGYGWLSGPGVTNKKSLILGGRTTNAFAEVMSL